MEVCVPAIPGEDGLDGRCCCWPEFLAVPAEYTETCYAMIVEEYVARRDSCGPWSRARPPATAIPTPAE